MLLLVLNNLHFQVKLTSRSPWTSGTVLTQAGLYWAEKSSPLKKFKLKEFYILVIS